MTPSIPHEHESRVRIYKVGQSTFVGFGSANDSQSARKELEATLGPEGYQIEDAVKPEIVSIEGSFLEIRPPLDDSAVQLLAQICLQSIKPDPTESGVVLVIDNRKIAPTEQKRLAVGTIIASSLRTN